MAIRTWEQFVESKKEEELHKAVEKAEEDTGIDYDHDKEEGESKEHIAKMKKARKKK